jgi:hypothetical protein
VVYTIKVLRRYTMKSNKGGIYYKGIKTLYYEKQ